MKEMLQLLAAQGAATIGTLARAWLWVLCGLWAAIAGMIAANGADPYSVVFFTGFAFALLLSVPVMLLLIVFHVARKW